jgi:hypothetical protein
MTKEARIAKVVNDFGIKVKRCCASCQHKFVDNDGIRFCTEESRNVSQKNKCKKWQLSDGLKMAGKGGGLVRNKNTKETEIE